MARTKRGGLVASIRAALTDDSANGGDTQALATPAACLALVYAKQIDEVTHVRATLDKALRTLRAACEAYEDGDEGADGPSALDAYAKVSAALCAVTVAADLGPKLLAALDALLLTPKARAAIDAKTPGAAAAPANPLDALRAEQDELKARRDRRAAG